MAYPDDPIYSKLNSFSAGIFTVLTELMIAESIGEQIFSRQIWTFHRATTLFELAAAGLLVPIHWYTVRRSFKRLSKGLLTAEAGNEGELHPPAYWAPLAMVPVMSCMVVFIVAMAFRSAIEH